MDPHRSAHGVVKFGRNSSPKFLSLADSGAQKLGRHDRKGKFTPANLQGRRTAEILPASNVPQRLTLNSTGHVVFFSSL